MIEPGVEVVPYRRPDPLPKVSLYAHAEVMRALRIVAADDGVLVQALLREAVSDLLARRGYRFSDLTTGQ